MSIKMPKAFFKKENRLVTISEFSVLFEQNQDNKNFIFCASPDCRIPLTFASGNIIRPYFRIKSGNYEHVSSCPFNTLECIKNIIKNSSPDLFEQVNDKKFNFKLNIAKSAIMEYGKIIKLNDYIDDGNKTSTKHVNKSTDNIVSYLRSTKEIVQLRARSENDAELPNTLKIKYHGIDIPWSKFYFDTDNWPECYSYLKNSDNNIHPVCVEGYIFGKINEPNQSFRDYSLKLISNKKPLKEKEKYIRWSVNLRISNNNFSVINYFSKLSKNTKIVIYGDFVITKSNFHEPSNTFYNNISTFVNHTEQIAVIDS